MQTMLLNEHVRTEVELTTQACKTLKVTKVATDDTEKLHVNLI